MGKSARPRKINPFPLIFYSFSVSAACTQEEGGGGRSKRIREPRPSKVLLRERGGGGKKGEKVVKLVATDEHLY